MQISNNVQSPNFGMLRAKASIPALRDSSTCTSGVVDKLNTAFDALKDTKFFHLEVGQSLGCRIVGAKDAYFGTESFPNATNGTSPNVVMVQNEFGKNIWNISKQDRTIDKDYFQTEYKEQYKEFEGYAEYNDAESWFPVYGVGGAYNNIDSLRTLVDLTLQLDKAAADNYAKSQKGLSEEAARKNEQYQAAVDAFESKLMA